MNINIKRDFDAIIKKYGHDVYLQRVSNPAEDNAVPVYNNKLEKWTVYSQFPGGSRRIARTAEEAKEGLITDVDMIFYFQSEANPTTGDRIYEEVDRYPDNQALYRVEYASPMRGSSGIIEFWTVGCMRKHPV